VQMPVSVNPNQFISHVQHTQRTAPLQPKVCGTRTQPHANHYSMIYRSGIMRLFGGCPEGKMNLELRLLHPPGEDSYGADIDYTQNCIQNPQACQAAEQAQTQSAETNYQTKQALSLATNFEQEQDTPTSGPNDSGANASDPDPDPQQSQSDDKSKQANVPGKIPGGSPTDIFNRARTRGPYEPNEGPTNVPGKPNPSGKPPKLGPEGNPNLDPPSPSPRVWDRMSRWEKALWIVSELARSFRGSVVLLLTPARTIQMINCDSACEARKIGE